MRWLSRQSTFKVGKRKTENVRWFSIRIFPFVKLGIGSGPYPQGAAGGREAAGVGVPACLQWGPPNPWKGPGHSNWGALMGGGLKNLSGGYLAPAMLRQRMDGAGIRLHSTLLKRSPMTVRLAA